MNVRFLPKTVTTTELRSRADEVALGLKRATTPYYAVTKNGNYLGVLISTKLFEQLMKDYIEDFIDARALEHEIETTKDEPGVPIEKIIEKRLGKEYVQNYLKEKGRKVSAKSR